MYTTYHTIFKMYSQYLLVHLDIILLFIPKLSAAVQQDMTSNTYHTLEVKSNLKSSNL